MTSTWHLVWKQKEAQRETLKWRHPICSYTNWQQTGNTEGHTHYNLIVSNVLCWRRGRLEDNCNWWCACVCLCVSHKGLSVSSADKCHQWCHFYLRTIFKTDHPKSDHIKNAFCFFSVVCAPTHTNPHFKKTMTFMTDQLIQKHTLSLDFQ